MAVTTIGRGGRPCRTGAMLAVAVVAVFAVGGCATGGASQSEGQNAMMPRPPLTAVTSPSADTTDWRGSQVARVEDLIAGRFAGVEVVRLANGGASIHIRGVNTLMGSTEPLYVIDGMVVEAGPLGALTGIDPRDVARIQVLKDPGETAMYGSRGANGVIVITTKRAR